MKQSNQFLGAEPIGKLMKKYAVPCIISLLVGALYNIVDQIFIANASYLGSYGNAANTVVFPLTVVALAIAVMIGTGHGKSSHVYRVVHDSRGNLWRGICFAAAAFLRFGRCSVFHAGIGFPDVYCGTGDDNRNESGIKSKK